MESLAFEPESVTRMPLRRVGLTLDAKTDLTVAKSSN